MEVLHFVNSSGRIILTVDDVHQADRAGLERMRSETEEQIKVVKAANVKKHTAPMFDRETLRRQLLSMLAELDRIEKHFCCEKCNHKLS